MEFVGFSVILLCGTIIVRTLIGNLSNQSVIDALSAYSPWLAEYSQTFIIASSVVLMLMVISVPMVIKLRDSRTGNNTMGNVGLVVSIGISVVAISYLVGVGVIAAKTMFNG